MRGREIISELVDAIQESCPDLVGWQAVLSRRELDEAEVALILVNLIERVEQGYPGLRAFYRAEEEKDAKTTVQ